MTCSFIAIRRSSPPSAPSRRLCAVPTAATGWSRRVSSEFVEGGEIRHHWECDGCGEFSSSFIPLTSH